eukprot:gene180-369_t
MQRSNPRFAADQLHREDSYARTYSTANDFAIACALSEIQAVIPRINPLSVPSATAISEDRQRLLLRLDMYALKEREVVGDGSCQFRAIADQLWFKQELHSEVREAVVAQLVQHADHYQNYVTTDYEQYVSSMSQAGTWGDHVTLQAAADAFNCRICIISSFLDNCVISITPTQQQEQQGQQPMPSDLELMQQAGQQLQQSSNHDAGGSDYFDRTLWLSFWAEVHYNSIAPKAPSPPSEGEMSSSSCSSSSEDELPRRNLRSK